MNIFIDPGLRSGIPGLYYMMKTVYSLWLLIPAQIGVYGTIKCRMDKIESQVMPIRPNVITSLRSGFDAIANKIGIIIIPVIIDLILWLGPHFQVKTLINNFLSTMSSSAEINSIQSGDLLSSSMEIIRTAVSHFNLLILIRTIPVGIPSLMASRSPVDIPFGAPAAIDITSVFSVVIITIGLMLIGLVFGCFYYMVVVQVALSGTINLKKVIKNWSWASIQVISLALAFLILFILISLPSSCAISAIALFGLPLGQFAIFLYIAVLLWLAFPLIFSAHGIFISHINALTSVQRSMMLTRMTLPSTSIFFILILAISEGLDILWKVPPETSWLTLIGVGGHAFITSALLAASFIYYRDADHWTQETLRIIKSNAEMPVQGG